MIKRKIRKSRVLLILLVVFAVVVTISFALNYKPTNTINPTPSKIQSPEEIQEENKQWIENHQKNSEYCGELKVGDDLVNESVTQTTDNEKYLNTSWDLQESSHGSIFMDYRNTLDDQNIIIYGHYVYADESYMFGPLHKLNDISNYEKNKLISLQLEKEVRNYEIAYVYYYEMDNPLLEYFHTNYSEEYFDAYKETISKKSFHNTGVEINSDDKIITLQTCVRNRDDLRLIVVAKEIE